MIENIRLSFRGIFAHKMRSFLTMLGIIIGIASIIAIVSTIKGTNDQIENNSNEQQLEKNENIIVHVSGAVNKEGIVELKNNSRIIDAIDKAGGLKDEADITNINLAYIIEDGMKIHIPSKEEKESTIIVESNTDSEIVKQNNGIKSDNNKKSKININTATKTDLETLPGIGESTALKIIEYRKEKGKFKLIEDIKQVNGIGENKFNKIKELITV